MAKIIKKFKKMNQIKEDSNQKGTATIIAVMVMSLLTGFVALSVARTSSESGLLVNDVQESRAFSVAEASLENMTLETDLVFESKFDIDTSDITSIQNKLPTGFPANYDFKQTLTKIKSGKIVDATGASLQGLKALRDEWLLDTLVTDTRNGVRANVRRSFFNNRVPIFQFGVFYDDDLDFSSAPVFNFGGRVHSNGNMYASSNNGLYFDSRITVKGQVVTDILSNGFPSSGNLTYIKDANQVDRQLFNGEGSALGNTVNGGNLFASSSWRPPVYRNASWATIKPRFGDNLLNEQPELKLPLKGGYIDLIQRGKNVGDLVNNRTGTVAAPSIVQVTSATTLPVTVATEDLVIAKKERYYNKIGIRISLADTKDRLPGCSNVGAAVCGIRLDGNALGTGDILALPAGNSRGYQPLPLNDVGNTINTRLNGDRFFIPGKENWIKIELVKSPLPGINMPPVTKDITADILSLGVTERANTITSKFEMELPYKNTTDSTSIVKLQRFYMVGEEIKVNSDYLTSKTWNGDIYNFVVSSDALLAGNPAKIVADKNPSFKTTDPASTRYGCHSLAPVSPATTACLNIDHIDHQKPVKIDNIGGRKVVPFPIMAFDTREGVPFDTNGASALNRDTLYPAGNLSVNGVMSAVDIDVANLRKFLKGDFDTILPATTTFAVANGSRLKSSDVSEANGWVVYFSDRRGDFDFDGEYDMEDIFGTTSTLLNTGVLTPGEDVNNNSTLQSDYVNEAPRYSEKMGADVAAVVNTRFYRRTVRLKNGDTVPGKYDLTTPEDTKGFTFASENGVYVIGNFNATGYDPAAGFPVPTNKYYPQNTEEHIPTSIVADAITILSNNWKDAKIFRYPFVYTNPGAFDARDRRANETTVRFAVITGDGLSFAPCVASFANGSNTNTTNATNGASTHPCVTGGVHNLNRFLEIWDGVKLHYTGSIINLYNSRNNNGSFKCCNSVYRPPNRDFSFDKTFLNPNRLPPGTPFIQSIQVTGFQKMNQ